MRTAAHVHEDTHIHIPSYRFPEPEILFKEVLEILRNNRRAVKWLTDQGASNVDDNPQYLALKKGLERSHQITHLLPRDAVRT